MPGVADQGLDQGVNGTAELQVAAEADRQSDPDGLFPERIVNRSAKSLGRMLVAAVTGIDDRESWHTWKRLPCGAPSFGWRIAADVSIAGDDADRDRATLSPLEAELESAEEKPSTATPQISSIAASKLESGACAWFIEIESRIFYRHRRVRIS